MKLAQSAWIVVLLAGLGWTGLAQAETLLRWKLEPGQSLVVDFQQQTTSTVAFSGKSAETKIDLGMELLWSVAGVDDVGIAVKQSIRRFQFKLESPKAGVIQYDSAAKTRPTGQARAIADAIKPLLGAEVEITMTDRGEIVAARPANAAADLLFAAPGAAEQPGVFSKQAVETMLRHPLVVFPEKPVEDDGSWKLESVLNAAAGTFKQSTTYRLAGMQEHDGQQLAKIAVSAVLEPQAKPAPGAAGPGKLTVKAHEQTGQILFSAQQGRLVSAEQSQTLSTERPYRETTITVTLASKQTTTVKPQ